MVSEWGLSDLLGNALEWTADAYHRDYREAPRDGRPWTQLNGGPAEDERSLRGGSFLSRPEDLRVSARDGLRADRSSRETGFRCAADADG